MPKRKRNRVRHGTPRKQRKLAIRTVGVVVLVFAFIAGITQRTITSETISSARAQQHDHSSHAPRPTVSPLVDGSEHPELIPDHVAIRALMQTLRISPYPDMLAMEQLHARVARVNLSDADKDILVRELGIFDTRASQQQARIESVRPFPATADRTAIARYVEEQERFGSLIVDHYGQLLASLSPEGAAKLQEHLLHVKSRIKIYSPPDMSADVH
jgi:hypothetical protein